MSDMDRMLEEMANDHAKFLADIKNEEWLSDLNEINAHGYPAYATSDFPLHAVRYAAGFKGNIESRYNPVVAMEKHAQLDYEIWGKVYIGLLTPQQLDGNRVEDINGLDQLRSRQAFMYMFTVYTSALSACIEQPYIYYTQD